MEIITVDGRYCGPPDSGNGGYVCGLLGSRFPATAEVTLRLPPPLNHPMTLRGDPDSGLCLMDGDQLVARACHAELDMTVPPLPSQSSVLGASGRYVGFNRHLFPGCFVCGPDRDAGDGLRVFAGPVDGTDFLAAIWEPDSRLADQTGRIRVEYIWASLDCPGYFAVAEEAQPMLLGRLTLKRERELPSGQACTVLAWALGRQGRKHYAGTALFDAQGQRIAMARAVWIELRDQRPLLVGE